MPVANDTASSKHGSNARSALSKSDREQIDAIDAVIDRMRKFTEPDPYILTIPQDDVEPRYHHYSRTQAEAWLYSSPFTRQEREYTQYQSFIFHEPGKSVYVQLPNQRSDDVSSHNAPQRSKQVTSNPTSNSSGPKKTMSLGDYKKKQQGGVSTTPELKAVQHNGTSVKQPAVKGPVERVKMESEDILAAVADESKHAPPLPKDAPAATTKAVTDTKRKREVVQPAVAAPPNQPTKLRNPIDESPPTKKARTMPTNLARNDDDTRPLPAKNTNVAPDTKKERDNTSRSQNAAPPRISPGMPPRLSPGLLPTKLSPLARKVRAPKIDASKPFILPKCISPLHEMYLEALQTYRKIKREAARSAEVTAAGVKKERQSASDTATNAPASTLPSSAARKDGRAGSKSPIARVSKGGKAVPSDMSAANRPIDKSIKEEASDRASRDSRSVQPSLLVRLKYRKSRREDIQRILRMRPQAAKKLPARTVDEAPVDSRAEKLARQSQEPVQQDRGHAVDHNAVGRLPKVKSRSRPEGEDMLDTHKPASREEEKEESSLKRKRTDVVESRKRPFTPVQPDASVSPAPLSTHKGHAQATPSTRRDFLSTTMKRELSQDSIAMQTPPAFSTPSVNNGPAASFSRPPSSQPNIKTSKQQAWESEQSRLIALGRELKHAAPSLLDNQRAADTARAGRDQKLAAIKSVESFLCFILAFTAGDEAALAAEPKRVLRPDPWEGLRGFFAFVKRLTEPYGPLSGLACSLAVVSYARVLEIHTRHPVSEKTKHEVMDFQANLQLVARDAENKLDIDTLLETFPRTWAKRSKRVLSVDQLEVARYGGPFKLPITMATSPVRAVRAAYAMLQEWAEKERLEYDFKLKL